MKLLTVGAAVAAATLAFSPIANAADANLAACVRLAHQVSDALNTAQPSPAKDSARADANAARAYCAIAMYTQGVARYSHALQLLGKS